MREGRPIEINIKDLIEKTQKEAYRNHDVLYNLIKDETKFRELEFRGKADVKKEFVNTFKTFTRPVAPEDHALFMERANQISTRSRWRV